MHEAPRDGVQGREGLVHQEDGGIDGQRAGDLDALFHPARELAGELLAIVPQPDQLQKALDYGRPAGAV